MKTRSAVVGSKGQVVLPREVRARLGVERGGQVEFVLDDRGVHLRPRRPDHNPFLAWIGAAPDGEAGAALDAQTRHAGLDADELRLLRAGPGARVTRLQAPDADEAHS